MIIFSAIDLTYHFILKLNSDSAYRGLHEKYLILHQLGYEAPKSL